jgi:CDP-glucose 4,6-dehydratase
LETNGCFKGQNGIGRTLAKQKSKMESMVKNKFTDFYKDKKIFLTGHTGFKGSWLLTWLTSLGAKVKGYALEPEYEQSLFNIIKNEVIFENTIADIRNKERLQQEIEAFAPDIIFHLAAQPLVRKSYQIPSETFEVNAVGTANLLESVIALPKKCTIICITTDKVYENKEQYYHYKEEDRLGGYDPYSASKAASEIVISSFRNSFFNRKDYKKHQKAVISARAGNVIGGGDWSADRIIPDIIRSLQNNQQIEIRSPNAVRPWQHVLEPLRGYLLLALLAHNNYPDIADAYNFGPNEEDHLPVGVVVQKAIGYWGSGSWKDVSNISQPHEAGLLMLAIDKAKNELKWRPCLNFEKAIEWTMNWYKTTDDKFNYTKMQIADYSNLF